MTFKPPQFDSKALHRPSSASDVFFSQRYINLDYYPPGFIPDDLGFVTVDKVNKFFTEGCLVKSIGMGIAGAGLGLLFGTFFFTLKPMDVDTSLPFMQQVRQQYKGFNSEVYKTAKNFGRFGFVFALVECALEKERAKRDVLGAVYTGCLSGAILAYRGGPTAMIGGCAMFGAISGVFEKYNFLS